MNNKQAFKMLKNTPIRAKENHIEYSKALHTALAALEKQIPKKVLAEEDKKSFHSLLCPICEDTVGYIDIDRLSMSCLDFCPNCGQALDYEPLSAVLISALLNK